MTHLRIILTVTDGINGLVVYRGAMAIRRMCDMLRPKFLNIVWPEGFESWPRQKRLEHLAQFLPKYTKLTLIREKKHTRRNKSLYLLLGNVPIRERRRQDPLEGGVDWAGAHNVLRRYRNPPVQR